MPLSTIPFEKTLYGFSGTHLQGKAWQTIKPLMDRMWEIIKTEKLPTEGISHCVYTGKKNVFVGVVLSDEKIQSAHLEKKEIRINKYAIWSHKGNFTEILNGYKILHEEIMKAGNREGGISIEIYGHVKDSDPQSDMHVLIEVD